MINHNGYDPLKNAEELVEVLRDAEERRKEILAEHGKYYDGKSKKLIDAEAELERQRSMKRTGDQMRRQQAKEEEDAKRQKKRTSRG